MSKTVTARISEETEAWLQRSFKTKSAGGEYLIPAIISVKERCIEHILSILTEEEWRELCSQKLPLTPGFAGNHLSLITQGETLRKINLLSLPERMILEIYLKEREL